MADKNNNRSNNNRFTYTSQSPKETRNIGKKLGGLLQEGDLVALNGELGAGKTCLIQGIALGLNSKARVSSPSFTLIKEYHGDKPIYHFDLYRLTRAEEFEDLGYEEYFYSDGITLIEWAEKIKYFLPDSMLLIKIIMSDEHYLIRKIIFKPIGNRYQNIVKELKRIGNFGD